jgi:hypothetical protein
MTAWRAASSSRRRAARTGCANCGPRRRHALRRSTASRPSNGCWLPTGRRRAPFIACALPRELYRALDSRPAHSLAAGFGDPALVRVWNPRARSIPADGWLLVGFGQTLTLVHTCNDQVAGLRTLRLPGAPDWPNSKRCSSRSACARPVRRRPTARDRQRLLWAGAADWLPAAATIAGLASRDDSRADSRTRRRRLPEARQPPATGAGRRSR